MENARFEQGIPFDDDFNMRRKLYDKRMVTSQLRLLSLARKVDGGFLIETMMKGPGLHAGVYSLPRSGATGTTEDGL